MNKLAFCLISSLVWFGLSVPTNAETTLEKIERTGILEVAIREDAAPFGYLDDRGNLQGYCLDFFALLENKLIEKLDRNFLIIKLLKSNPTNRFSLVAGKTVNLECGPNTIQANIPEKTQFSTGFLTTGIQFLIKATNTEVINLDLAGHEVRRRLAEGESDRNLEDINLEDIKVGAINNTTAIEFIKKLYPLAKLTKFQGTTARSRGVQAVEQGRIAAMVSDGILLRAAAQQQGLSSQEYPLIPKQPLTCDRYGMIIPGNDPEWKNFVDSVIVSSEAAVISNTWFERLGFESQADEDYCIK